MSGTSGSETCPRCGTPEGMTTAYDWRPHQSCSGTCLVCGYAYWTELGIADKEYLDELRRDMEHEPVEITEEMKQRMKEYDESYGIKVE